MTPTTPTALPRALFIMRWSAVIFLLPWTLEKFLHPEKAQGIAAAFYFVDELPLWGSYLQGLVWVVLLGMFAFGIKKVWSYGLVALFHGVSTLSTTGRLLAPYESVNHLFYAAIPTLALLVALWMLREHDTIGTLGGSRRDTLVSPVAA